MSVAEEQSNAKPAKVAHPAIYAAIAKVMFDVGSVGKERKNQQQGYQFRGIDDVMAHVQGVMAKHGVICIPSVRERERELIPTKSGGSMASVRLLVDHIFYAPDGSSVTCTTLGEAMDSGDKASNKAMSAALKYALVETFMIPTYEVDRDTEEHSPEMARLEEKPTQRVPQKPHPAVDAAKKTFPGAKEQDPWSVGRFKQACERIWPGITESDYQDRTDGALGLMGCNRKMLPAKGDVWSLFNTGNPEVREKAVMAAEDMLRDRDDVPDFKGDTK